MDVDIPVLDCSKHCDTVLINSNFNCGFFINRERLFEIMKRDYKLQCSYDPCSYPGVQCKYYYYGNDESEDGRQKDTDAVVSNKVSFMIFRTGSVLIVGKCTENVIMLVYAFIKTVFQNNYNDIVDVQTCDGSAQNTGPDKQVKKKKLRRFARIAIASP